MTEQQALQIATPGFLRAVNACIGQRRLLEQFDRLQNRRLLASVSVGEEPNAADMQAFLDFVWDCVWTRLPQYVRDEMAGGTT